MRHYRSRRDDILTKKPLPAFGLNENWLRSLGLAYIASCRALIGVFPLPPAQRRQPSSTLPWNKLLLSRIPTLFSPEMSKIQSLEKRASPLRNVLREKNNPTIRVLYGSKPMPVPLNFSHFRSD